MSETRRFPFGGVPVYNPLSLSKDEALAQFHARQTAYESLMKLLREERPSHVLIIGTRGMGKTTLLQRVHYGVEDDAELNSRYLVLAFPEEQYNVNRLHRFLLNTVDALADAMEKLRNKQMLARVEQFIGTLDKLSQEETEEQVPKLLAEVGQEIRRSFLLLVDNADRLFDKIEEREQWRLRELLSSRRDLTLFGATTQASEGVYGPDRAFFEFFKVHLLTPLTPAEVRELLLRMSDSVEEAELEKGSAKRRVEEWLAADTGRLDTLVHLTGGNPRTTVMLFHLVLDGLDGRAREYLEQLLDQCTPTYKGRVDELPSQAQQVFDAVALRWDPVMAMEVAAYTGLETSAVSAQLTRLVRQGLLEKADPGDSKKALYQVAERFFNIWYLMRASRRVRAKLRWFVEFLRVFFDPEKLEQMAWARLKGFGSAGRTRPAEFETAFAYVLASGADRNRIEDYLRRECADKEPEWRPYVDSMRCPENSSPGEKEALRKAVEIDPDNAENWRRLGRVLAQGPEFAEAEAALLRAIELDPESAWSWNRLGDVLTEIPDRATDAEAAYRRAIELEPTSAGFWADLGSLLEGTPKRADEAEAALRKAIDLDPELARPWNRLGDVLTEIPERRKDAEAAYRKAVDLEPKSAGFWADLGGLLGRTPERRDEAEAALRKAIELDPKFAWPWAGLGALLGRTPERAGEAEAVLRKAIELDPKFVWPWASLGLLLGRTPERADEAEAALRKAIELDPKDARPWDLLGDLVGSTPERAEEAEAAYRKAIDFDPESAGFWDDLGDLLVRTPERAEDAEAAYRKAIELDPESAWFWDDLGDLLARTPARAEDAEAAYRKAIELDPKSAWFWADLGSHLRSTPERADEAEAALRKAIELDQKEAWFWVQLGIVLGEMPDRLEEAEAAFGSALEKDPRSGDIWGGFGVFLACRAGKPREAEAALRKSVGLEPNSSRHLRNLGVLLYCEMHDEKGAVECIRRAHQLDPTDPVSPAVSAAILAACVRGSESGDEQRPNWMDASRGVDFWGELLVLCHNYAPFGKILLGICDLVQERESSNRLMSLYRAVALAQLRDFPRASVALEDALVGDPIDLFSAGRRALEVFFAAAVRCERVRDCLELLDKKGWKDAWRPIYEALRAVEEGSGEYLKRVAVEIREPAVRILRRIAPQLPGLPARTR